MIHFKTVLVLITHYQCVIRTYLMQPGEPYAVLASTLWQVSKSF